MKNLPHNQEEMSKLKFCLGASFLHVNLIYKKHSLPSMENRAILYPINLVTQAVDEVLI